MKSSSNRRTTERGERDDAKSQRSPDADLIHVFRDVGDHCWNRGYIAPGGWSIDDCERDDAAGRGCAEPADNEILVTARKKIEGYEPKA